jgi:3-hydroxyacyl-[acyl-carrier-protein] dehydratase
MSIDAITTFIPHRPPFLWVDRIVSCTAGAIVTEKHIPENLEVLQGHFPGNPIMPGVLLCEAVFQSAAILMGKIDGRAPSEERQLPFLTRITNAKFRKAVVPGDTAHIEVKLMESLASACYFRGVLKVAGKVALQVDFACKMTTPADQSALGASPLSTG